MPALRLKTPFEYTGGNLCLDFANTVNGRLKNSHEELLTGYDRLLQWAEESGAITRRIAEQLQRRASEDPGSAQFTVKQAIRLREAIYEIFCAVAEHREIAGDALAVLNKAVHQSAQQSQIVHSHHHFFSEWMEPESHLDAMLWPVARAAADLLTSDALSYIRECAADDCAWLFLDKTKNHRRRWCEMKSCGNRAKARRYYHRQAAG